MFVAGVLHGGVHRHPKNPLDTTVA